MTFLYLAEASWFWFVAIPLLLAFLCWQIEDKGNSGFASLVFIASLAGLELFSDVKPMTFIWHHPFQAIWLAAAYIALGTLYVWVKWFSYVHTAARRMREKSSDGYKPSPSSLGYKSFPLQVKDYKEMIFGWMFYWPISGAWTILNDPIRRIFNHIYDRIGGSLQRISNKAFAE